MVQYRSFKGLDNVQNLGGGQPLCLNFAKLRNEELQWLKFSLSFCGDLLCLVLRSLGKERDSVAKERIIHNMTDMKTFKSIVADEETSVNAIRKGNRLLMTYMKHEELSLYYHLPNLF